MQLEEASVITFEEAVIVAGVLAAADDMTKNLRFVYGINKEHVCLAV
jgi:hypothetical protein